jgi:ElaB/YqjD/DUF883 family membrane-anchored ribosome-binding protein
MEDLVKIVAEPLGALLLVMVNAGLAMAIRWINQRTKSENIQLAVGTLGTVVEAEVARLNQQVVKALKNDGRFSEDEKAQIKSTARAAVQDQLTPAVQKAAGYAVQDVEVLVNSMIERAVTAAKAPQPASINLVVKRKAPLTAP